ncbi:MAG TPA: 5-formyltetrahydrofolate cyclo-ligase [Sphingomonas sp.]|nr:5-formyltetrahydrofolate cyclo-ligase [Sphingomonas sp.]
MAVPPPFPAADKAALRRELRARRAALVAGLSEAERAERCAAIERRLRPLLAREGPIAGYVAHRGEPDILPLLLAAFHLGHRIALPRIDETGAMRFLAWDPDAPLAPGRAGILQPVAGEPIAPAVILAPLVGFDRAGRRLGQGGGHYDRWFAAHPEAMRVGVAWAAQELPALAADPWDMPLHAIATEQEWIEV